MAPVETNTKFIENNNYIPKNGEYLTTFLNGAPNKSDH
jgi:hypothetical protein